MVGSPKEEIRGRAEAGQISIYRRGPLRAGTSRGRRFHQGAFGIPGKVEAGDHFGATLVVADLNGDGIDDVAVGVPDENFEGRVTASFGVGVVHFLFGQPSHLLAQIRLWDQGRPGHKNETADHFGSALSYGDYNDDGIADLVVGVPGESIEVGLLPGGDIDQVGDIWIIPGRADGLRMDGTERSLFQSGQERADLGEGRSEPGDPNGQVMP